MTRLHLLCVGLALGACTNSSRLPTMSPGGPAVEVTQRAGEPLLLVWNPPRALRVEIREVETGRVVWRAAAEPTRDGPRVDVLPAPLTVEACGVAPDSDPRGGFPPDGSGAWATAPELSPGTRYTVTVTPCLPSGEGTPQASCPEQPPLSTDFTTLRP